MSDIVSAPFRDGATFDYDLDAQRLAKQHNRVYVAMKDGKWRTLAELALITGDPEASVSARLRDLRKERFGAHLIDRRRRTAGQYEYRLVLGQREMF